MKLNGEQKTFVVIHLAHYDTSNQVARAASQEFNIRVSRQQVEQYNPLRSGKKPAKRWCDLFFAARSAFLDGAVDIAGRHKITRLRRLNRMSEAAEEKGNIPLAAALLEQMARETGGYYTNKHVMKHQGDRCAP